MTRPEPRTIHDGLAIYALGTGEPLFLMPNPQGFVMTSTAASPLARVLQDLKREIVTFDPPGAFNSSRKPELGLAEIISCSEEALDALSITEPVDVVGHSQGALAVLALALERPHRVRRLVLIGAVEGGIQATWRARGMPWCWSPFDARFWRFNWLGLRLSLGGGNVALYKQLMRLYLPASFVDKSKAPPIAIEPGDEHKPAPARAAWQKSIARLDLRDRLSEIHMLTLVCVGRYDPQTPLRGNVSIARRIPAARLLVFEHSGHYPFIEEPERFVKEVQSFLEASAENRPEPPTAATTGQADTA